VSKAGYYAWRERALSVRASENEGLATKIALIHRISRRSYGSRRIASELRSSGCIVSRNRVARLMRIDGIYARRKRQFRVTTMSRHSYEVVGNLVNRQFTVDRPNAVWVADITYFSTREGWLYLAIVLDLFSRRIVGWSMSTKINTSLVLSALDMAISSRAPNELIVHTDRGSQYSCTEYRTFLSAHNITPSMSRKRDCWDNAVAESFFSTLKTEIRPDTLWATRAEARAAIFEYIEVWYNRRRRHSTIGYVSPAAFETANVA